jgi:hypothetical protein
MFDVLFIYCTVVCVLVAIDSGAPTLDNLQDLQLQDFEQFEQHGKCPGRILYLFSYIYL